MRDGAQPTYRRIVTDLAAASAVFDDGPRPARRAGRDVHGRLVTDVDTAVAFCT